jgi:hypothetical protein
MTTEKLHDKGDIAAELAYRDARIDHLEEALKSIAFTAKYRDAPDLQVVAKLALDGVRFLE